MRAAAADLDFEEAARLRDEIKRLRATELAVVDDPTAKYPSPAGGGSARQRGGGGSPSPLWGGSPAEGGRGGGRSGKSGPRKPTLDEMGPGVDSIPAGRDKPSGPRSSLGRPGMRGGWKPRGR